MAIDTMPALWAMVLGMPGFEASGLGQLQKRFSWLVDPPDYYSDPYICHFPDGNASIPRLLVRKLIPGVAPGTTMEDIVRAPFDYSRLDGKDASVRLRLSSTAVNVQNRGDPKTAQEVGITYVRHGQTFHARARSCVLACYNRIIPHLCPDLPAKQKEALGLLVKTPLVYTNVLLRNWKPWKKLGVAVVHCPSAYHHYAMLDFPVNLGGYQFSSTPDDPIVVHMERLPSKPGLPASDQNRAGRLELLTTTFEQIERDIRSHFAGMLGGEGFDPALDIEAITVNRWPHGYSWLPTPVSDPDYEEDEVPYVIGRERFGRIAIANSDAGGNAMVEGAIDQAHRAITDLEG
jgi:spermidine dehydrogenase